MSNNIVHQHGTDRLSHVLATTAHKAGDLVWEAGFYGTCQDDVAANGYFTLLLAPTVNFPYVPSTLGSGVIVAAPATTQPTSLPLLAYSAKAAASGIVPGPATAGWFPVGKTIATGTASTARVQLFNPNPYQTV